MKVLTLLLLCIVAMQCCSATTITGYVSLGQSTETKDFNLTWTINDDTITFTSTATGFAIDDDNDLGSGPMLFVRRSDGNLGVGTATPVGTLSLSDQNPNIRFDDEDTSNNGEIDQWTKWSEMKESYEYIDGFSKQIKKIPAKINLTGLPEANGFQVEVKLSDITSNSSKPLIESMDLSFND